MRLIEAGVSGGEQPSLKETWQDLPVPAAWIALLKRLGENPRPVQVMALQDKNILGSRRNLLVSAPTNSGKSLVGLLLLLEALSQGKRAVLLEPLRALAREKADELERLADAIATAIGKPIAVKISTGDYRLEDELAADPPPEGELLVATPERLEALLRNPKNSAWFETVGAVCVDEAHLISTPRRGPTLEYLVTALLCLPSPPRLALLSATMGDWAAAERWLAPCDVVVVRERYPALEKWVLELEDGEDANEVAIAWAQQHLNQPKHQLLIFVYQTQSANKLAKLLNGKLLNGQCEQPDLARAYHGRLSQAERESVRQIFLRGDCRVVVTTTALSLGMNLPASHVLVRDNTFAGVGRLSCGELLQMMGRAGRGDRPGTAAVLVKPKDGWSVEELTEALREEKLPEFCSGIRSARWRGQNNLAARERNGPVGVAQVAALLCRSQEQGQTVEALQQFLARSLGAEQLVESVSGALRWLLEQTLAYQDAETGAYRLTVLGQRASRAALPLPLAAGYAQLLRDLMTLDSTDELLGSWRPLDHLLILDLLSERPPSLRRYSAKLVGEVDAWCEAQPERVPLLFRQWMRGDVAHARTAEILGSLGLEVEDEAGAHREGYLAMFRGMVLGMRSQGIAHGQIERRYGVRDLAGIEERWRDELLWLLSGLGRLLEIRTFYFHLKEDCGADFARVKRVKRRLRQMRFQVYGLQEQLKYCSPLGNVLGEMRRLVPRGMPQVGVATVRRLEEAGVQSLRELAQLSEGELVARGVQRRWAEQIRAYVSRRRR